MNSSTLPTRAPRRARRTTSRRALGLAAAIALGIATALVPTGPALAADGPFTVDGTVPDVSPAPAELPDVFGNVKELGPKNASTTKIGVIHSAATPMLDNTNPNAQVDLRRAWLTTARDSGTQHDWLYFAWERDSNSGSGFIAYEFMQNPAPAGCAYGTATPAQLIASCNPWANRKAGDFMILWDQNGSSLNLSLRTWTGTAPNLTLGAPVPLNAAVSQAQYSADGFRGEAAVDLTATVFGGSSACKAFTNTIPSTVTGNSDTADYKDTILQTAPPITNCSTGITTTPKTGAGASIPASGLSIGTGAVAVKDRAVVTLTGGNNVPAGSVTFSLCKLVSGTCSSGGTTISTNNLTGLSYPATVDSDVVYVTSAGRYCWRSEFSGVVADGIPPASESAANECFTVNATTPTLSTDAGADSVVLGSAISDSATLTGTVPQPTNPVINTNGATGSPAGGTITFRLYGPSNTGCGDLRFTSSAVPVTGDGTYQSPTFTPGASGNYHWVATYSGSSPNTNGTDHNTACDDTAEDVTVTTVPSTMTTAQRWVPNDSATISASAGGALAGTVSFTLYPSSDCTGTPVFPAETQSVTGTSPQTVSTTNTTAVTASGDFSWSVSYDSTNTAQDDIGASCHEVSSLTVDNNAP
ncbi:MAG: hypothetical protein J7518_02810 [Nocardioidaceae bacterium]|nr:hypothetical protein [Nocardioidaceae bacterium]